MRFRLSLLLLCLLLAACGDLPEPFLGNPGATGRMLARPLTPRLAVPAPGNALLSDTASRQYADAIAASLQTQEIPALASKARRNDWQLVATAEQRGATVIPVFNVLDPRGQDKGKVEGNPVPTAQWATATPVTLGKTAMEAAPKITSLLNSIQTALLHANPNSLYNRMAKVVIAPVTGAPGDGNAALTKEMKSHLATLGPQVQDSTAGADFLVQGNVKLVALPGNQQRVEIQWSVKAANGDERGRVVQLNVIPAGSLDHYWADVATVVATEAAGGVNDVILRQSGREPAQRTNNPQVRGQQQGPLLERPGSGIVPAR